MAFLTSQIDRRRCYLDSVKRAGRYWRQYVQIHHEQAEALEKMQANILHTLHICSQYVETHGLAAELAHAFQSHMISQGNWQLWTATLDHLLTQAAFENLTLRAFLLEHLAESLTRLERFEEATVYAERAVILFREYGTPQALARALIDLSVVYFNREDWEQSERAREEALSLGHQHNVSDIVADALILRGRSSLKGQRYEEAIHWFTRARSIAITATDHSRIIGATNFLGTAYFKLEQFHEALSYYLDVFDLVCECANRPGQSVVAYNLGRTYLALGHPEQARDYLNFGLSVARETDDHRAHKLILETLRTTHAA